MIDTTKTTCQSATSPHVLKIPLDTYRVINDFGNPDLQTTGITDIALSNTTPCRLVFKSGTAVTAASPLSFSFQITDPNSLRLWSVTNSYSASGLDRQTVSISPSSGNYRAFVGDNAANITLDFTPQLPTLPAYPLYPLDTSQTFNNQITLGLPSSCSTLVSGAITSTTRSTLTFTPSTTIVPNGCSGTLTVSYGQSSWFKANASTTIQVSVTKHTAQMSVTYIQGTNYLAFPPNTVNKAAYNIRIPVSDGDTHSTGYTPPIPSGTVEVWLADSAGVEITPGSGAADIYNITTGTYVNYDATSKHYQVQINSGNADFVLNLLNTKAGVKLRYKYLGDTYFSANPASGQLETPAFSIP
jgi:hypothetical protein